MQLINAARRVGITYRQAHYWVKSGHIEATYEDKYGDPASADFAGSGFNLVITPDEYRVLALMHHLVAAGVTPAKASGHARRLIGGKSVRIGPLVLAYAKPPASLGSDG